MKKMRVILLSSVLMLAVAGLLFVILTLLITKMGTLMRDVVPVITTVIGCAAALIGGLAASAGMGEKGLLTGALCGVIMVAIMMIPGGFNEETIFTLGSAGKMSAVILSGCIGGVLGVNRKKTVKF